MSRYEREAGLDADPDAGAATVWAAVLLVLVTAATVLAVGATTATGARHAAQLAADLAALAGAGRIGVDPADVCAAAGRTAAANDAAMSRCAVALTGPRTGEVRVEVTRSARWAGFDLDARARSRAARIAAAPVGSPAHTASNRTSAGSARAPPRSRPHSVCSPRCERHCRVAA